MQAALTLPEQLNVIPITMSKINKNVYFEESTKNFYKVTVLQPMTMFTNNDVLTRQNIVLTRYNPAYLALHLLAQNGRMSTNSIPVYLTYGHFQQFVDVDEGNGFNAIGNGISNGFWIRPNTEKILNFLQKRIDQMVRIIQERQYNKVVKKFDYVDKSQTSDHKKTLAPQITQILRKQIPDVYMDELFRSRYHQKKAQKPVILDTFTEQAHREQNYNKNKEKKKAVSKSKTAITIVPKNQMSLFQFSSKKKKEEEEQKQKN